MEVLSGYIIDILFAALLFLAQWGLRNYLGVAIDGKVMEYVRKGVRLGRKRAKKKLGNAVDEVDFDNEVINQAIQFVSSKIPKWLEKAGIDENFLRDLLESELEEQKAVEKSGS